VRWNRSRVLEVGTVTREVYAPQSHAGLSDQSRMAPLFLSRRPLVSFVLQFSFELPMDESVLERQLRAEGFRRTYVWQDSPHTHYPAHTHASLTAHIILDGEMTLTVAGESHTYRAGERCDVAAGAVHAARMGPSGCRYLIGEK